MGPLRAESGGSKREEDECLKRLRIPSPPSGQVRVEGWWPGVHTEVQRIESRRKKTGPEPESRGVAIPVCVRMNSEKLGEESRRRRNDVQEFRVRWE